MALSDISSLFETHPGMATPPRGKQPALAEGVPLHGRAVEPDELCSLLLIHSMILRGLHYSTWPVRARSSCRNSGFLHSSFSSQPALLLILPVVQKVTSLIISLLRQLQDSISDRGGRKHL